MNTQRIAEEFRYQADPTVDGRFEHLPSVTTFTSQDVVLPRLVVSATFKGLGKSSNVGRAVVSLKIESNAAGDAADAVSGPAASAATTPEEAHENRVNLVRAKFFGLDEETMIDARAALAAAITANGKIEVDPRYVPTGEVGMLKEADRLVTTLALACGVVIPPVAV